MRLQAANRFRQTYANLAVINHIKDSHTDLILVACLETSFRNQSGSQNELINSQSSLLIKRKLDTLFGCF